MESEGSERGVLIPGRTLGRINMVVFQKCTQWATTGAIKFSGKRFQHDS